MAISVNPNLPLVALQGVTADVLLQPGAVLQAKVLSVGDNNQVRIAIGGQTVEATTQVPLQAGQTLQVSVSQTDAGVRLAIVNQPVTTTTAQAALAASGAAVDRVTLGPQAIVLTSAQAAPSIVPAATPTLTPQQAAAVATAAATAVTQQTGLSALFANLGAVANSSGLPVAVREAAAQVLAQQLPTANGLTGADIQKAFQSSGIFLEAALASGTASTGVGTDLKAALLVLRQVLSTALGAATAQAGSATTTPVLQNGQGTSLLALTAQLAAEANLLGATTSTAAAMTANGTTTSLPLTASPTLAASATAAGAAATSSASTSEQSLVQNVIAQLTGTATSATAQAQTAATSTAATLSALQQALQADPQTAAVLAKAGLSNPVLLSLLPALTGNRIGKDDSGIARTNTPPPPFPGALPAAQPVMPANLTPHAPVDANLRRILTETEGALARQTLLQVASLPDRTDAAPARVDAAQPRWAFEIPLATPQGTAVAQFEISRDRDEAAQAAGASGTVWQARFSLDVEPAGPVHALISLRGEKTSVRLWAERPATTALLRAGAADLGRALARADLVSGDIVVRDGAPPAPRPAVAGHFLDRAL
ncbi:flagellar hook-length control protein FliK [Rhodopseudomonas palustris]|uniref:flagellar hook-length control protein FliK n=1 Tax=Rhodopseudomonas palustris TaxID=1076 RepID=UPI000E5B98A2|nr:flagellar hook-length control protein FliK [Rhodopseudomonas palustris]QLH72234.1 flagellar hook-length control protein FliK [Rhodopseudomonas palustris]RHZ98889.1 flagellar hook-length control protein FliK [Rhodopseudomonas palustris]